VHEQPVLIDEGEAGEGGRQARSAGEVDVATRPCLESVDERDEVLIGADGDRLGVVPFSRGPSALEQPLTIGPTRQAPVGSTAAPLRRGTSSSL
jgi:hypothetical protein